MANNKNTIPIEELTNAFGNLSICENLNSSTSLAAAAVGTTIVAIRCRARFGKALQWRHAVVLAADGRITVSGEKDCDKVKKMFEITGCNAICAVTGRFHLARSFVNSVKYHALKERRTKGVRISVERMLQIVKDKSRLVCRGYKKRAENAPTEMEKKKILDEYSFSIVFVGRNKIGRICIGLADVEAEKQKFELVQDPFRCWSSTTKSETLAEQVVESSLIRLELLDKEREWGKKAQELAKDAIGAASTIDKCTGGRILAWKINRWDIKRYRPGGCPLYVSENELSDSDDDDDD